MKKITTPPTSLVDTCDISQPTKGWTVVNAFIRQCIFKNLLDMSQHVYFITSGQ